MYYFLILQMRWRPFLLLPVVLDVGDDVHGGSHHADADQHSVGDLLGERNSGSGRSWNPGLVGEVPNQGPGGGYQQSSGCCCDHFFDFSRKLKSNSRSLRRSKLDRENSVSLKFWWNSFDERILLNIFGPKKFVRQYFGKLKFSKIVLNKKCFGQYVLMKLFR